MKRFYSLLFSLSILIAANAQVHQESDWKKMYRAFPTKVNDLVHTRLDASFNYAKSQLNGKAWLTLTPHFYRTDSVTLDAKGMDIHEVAIIKNGKNVPLNYSYKDSLFLHIKLDKSYAKGERYTVYIAYTAKPNDFKVKGSSAITDAKGLYFINPTGEDKSKPTQIWTQGETKQLRYGFLRSTGPTKKQHNYSTSLFPPNMFPSRMVNWWRRRRIQMAPEPIPGRWTNPMRPISFLWA
jgi:aminopeptidase N